MDDAFISHVIYWLIGAMAVVGIVGVVGAWVSMVRSGYRKD